MPSERFDSRFFTVIKLLLLFLGTFAVFAAVAGSAQLVGPITTVSRGSLIPPPVAAIAVTGHIGDPTGAGSTANQVRFELTNCGAALPRVIGHFTLAPRVKVYTADSTGLISGTIWANDQIDCGGSSLSRYLVTYLVNNTPVGQQYVFNITSLVPFNLDSATPINSYPPASAPNTDFFFNSLTLTTFLSAQDVFSNFYHFKSAPAQCPALQAVVGMTIDFGLNCQAYANLAGAVALNPAGNQTVVQPGGTSLSVNNLQVAGGTTNVFTSPINNAFITLGTATPPSSCVDTSLYIQSTATAGQQLWACYGGLFHQQGLSSGVTSFNGRTGVVAPTSGDYSYAQISGTPTLQYQTVKANGTPATQRPALNFSNKFTVTDSGAPAQSTVDLANTAVSPGTYVNPASVTVGADGRVTSITGGSTTGITQGTATTSTCLTGAASYSSCRTVLTWPAAFPDNIYVAVCNGFDLSVPADGTSAGEAPTVTMISHSTTTITVSTQTQRGQTAQYNEIDCIGWHQ